MKVKEGHREWNDKCALNAIYGHMCCYDHCTCLYEVCELYDDYCIKFFEVLTQRYDGWFSNQMSSLDACFCMVAILSAFLY